MSALLFEAACVLASCALCAWMGWRAGYLAGGDDEARRWRSRPRTIDVEPRP